MKNRIKELRDKKAMSQEKLALGAQPPTTKAQISKLEKGDRKLTVQWAMRLAPALDCHWTELIGAEGEQLTAEEKALIYLYRSMVPADKKRFHVLGNALAQCSRIDEDDDDGCGDF